MNDAMLPSLGATLRAARKDKGLTQGQLAKRLGREQGRVSELETDLIRGRLGKDRLTLLVEMCHALDLVPVLLPRSEAVTRAQAEIHARASQSPGSHPVGVGPPPRSTFDELFIDLGEEEEPEGEGRHG